MATAIAFVLFLAAINWKVSVFVTFAIGILAYFLGPSTALVLTVGYVGLLLILKAVPAFILGVLLAGVSSFVGLWGAISGLVLVVVLVLVVSFLVISRMRKSVYLGLRDTSTILFAMLLHAFSTFVSRIELIGAVFSPHELFRNTFSYYPGFEFARERREDFVDRGVEYVKEGVVEVDKPPNELARDTRRAYDEAGTMLSNGEVSIAICLVVVSFVPLLREPLMLPNWLMPPGWLGGVLSLVLIVAVGLRYTALDAVLYQDVTADEDPHRLLVMSAWNQGMSNGTRIIKSLAEFKAVITISESAYDFYLDWVLDESLRGDGVGIVDVLAHWRPFLCFVFADLQGTTPLEVSEDWFDTNVFEESGSRTHRNFDQ